MLDQFINMPLPEGEEMDTRPFFPKRNDMMVNILKNMRNEIAVAKQVRLATRWEDGLDA